MNGFFIYIVQSAVCLGALYLIYWFFLRKDTFFSANRFYLIGSIIVSFILPLFKVPVFVENPEIAYVVMLDTITVTTQKIESDLVNNLSFYQGLFIVYLTGASLFLLRFAFQLLQLFLLIRKFGVTQMDGLNIVKIKSKYSPFSYFKYIFLNEDNLKDKDLQSIIRHEKIHIKQKHSLDLIMLELLSIVQWFNPFMWMYKRSIKGIHEYLADEGLLAEGVNKSSYQDLLLSQAVGIQINELTNNFNQSLITKRFIMMTKLQSKKIARFKLLLVFPVAVVLISLFAISCKQNEVVDEKVTDEVVETQTTTKSVQSEEPKGVIFAVVEEMPTFPGGENARLKFLANNIKYPETARIAGVEGRVYVTFVVEVDGSVNDVRILRGIGSGCDEETVRVISAMPKWNPGKQRGQAVRVQFNLPVRFYLGGEQSSKNKETTSLTYKVVEQMPEFSTDNKSLEQFLKDNIKYPEEARNAGIQGTVYINFLVKEDGSIDNLNILRGIGSGCDEEALRVVKMMSFKPGKQGGEIVPVEYNLPIKFILD